jgi:CRP-like cAMP-binding protein
MIQGDNADDGVHLLVSGELDVCTLRSDGRLQRVATLVPGQLVGELALAGLRVRTATVIARGEVEVRSLSLASFKELVASNPRLDSTILSHLCIELAEKFTMANRLVTGLTQADAPAVGAIIERAKTSTYWRRAKARRDKIDPELVSVLAPE